MNLGTSRIRLALATFDAGTGLVPALRELHSAGFVSSQLGIAGLAAVINRTMEVMHCPLLSGLEHGLIPASDDKDQALVLGSSTFWRPLDCFGRRPGEAVVVARWMAPHLRDELAGHIASGAIVLGVTPTHIAQQARCAHILLSYSSDRVQTHEFQLQERSS